LVETDVAGELAGAAAVERLVEVRRRPDGVGDCLVGLAEGSTDPISVPLAATWFEVTKPSAPPSAGRIPSMLTVLTPLASPVT
jgi:hypothetical protein